MNIYDIGLTIIDEIKAKIPLLKKGFIGQTVVQSDGRIYILSVSQDEKKGVILLDDTHRDHFYIRFDLDKITYEKLSETIVPCQDAYNRSIPARLVFWVYDIHRFNFIEHMDNILIPLASNLPNHVSLEIQAVNLDSQSVLSEEKAVEYPKIGDNLSIIAYDLLITAPFYPQSDVCLSEIPICKNC